MYYSTQEINNSKNYHNDRKEELLNLINEITKKVRKIKKSFGSPLYVKIPLHMDYHKIMSKVTERFLFRRVYYFWKKEKKNKHFNIGIIVERYRLNSFYLKKFLG